jgi:divalent metal cation (Fe/Co/Zn/Cd) transporter
MIRNPLWDALGSIAIGVVLIVVAIGLGNEIMALLIGQSADQEVVARMREFLQRQDGVEKVFRLLTLQLGTSLMVALKLKMRADTAAELVSRLNSTERALRAEFPEIQWLFVEPDVTDCSLV